MESLELDPPNGRMECAGVVAWLGLVQRALGRPLGELQRERPLLGCRHVRFLKTFCLRLSSAADWDG